jgi:adenylylsulfate kinase
MVSKNKNIFYTDSKTSSNDRQKILNQKGLTIWLTGLSGSGKTTIALNLEQLLIKSGFACYVLDGDNIRHGLSKDLGLSELDRKENMRRIGEVCCLFSDAGLVTIASFISPYESDRSLLSKAH